MDLEFRFPKDGMPAGYSVVVEQDGWGTEKLPDGKRSSLVDRLYTEALGRGILARHIYYRTAETPPKTIYVRTHTGS